MIYQRQTDNHVTYKIQCHKTLIKTCIKNGWVEDQDDDTVIVTEKGMEAAKEIAPLYEHDRSAQIGQTF